MFTSRADLLRIFDILFRFVYCICSLDDIIKAPNFESIFCCVVYFAGLSLSIVNMNTCNERMASTNPMCVMQHKMFSHRTRTCSFQPGNEREGEEGDLSNYVNKSKTIYHSFCGRYCTIFRMKKTCQELEEKKCFHSSGYILFFKRRKKKKHRQEQTIN